jgi:hypothetical protein
MASSCRGKTPDHQSEGAHEGEEEREAREGVRSAPPRLSWEFGDSSHG